MKTSSEHRFIGREPFEAALRAGECAPSVYGTRPWTISDTGGRISLRADPDRRLAAADPGSRELVISCGAALYNVRLALRAHGVRPRVALLPDPERPALLAEVRADGPAEPGVLERLLYGAVERRRTHRGTFLSDVGDVRLMRALSAAAAAEGAVLHLLTDDSAVRSLAGLVTAAEHLQRGERTRGEELARWVRPPGGPPGAGVRAEDFPPSEGAAETPFPGRDYGRGGVRGLLAPSGQATGTVAVLTTAEDGRPAHLAAGQALQRVLLTAAAGGVSAAFHTQPLEEPLLRAFLGERLCRGAHPQMVLRLGRTRPPERAQQDALQNALAGF
ncbi:Acg family FMN-binding oxidoreductase [Nocardiopsis composta]|uniref:Nitroreductase n=1 Tax=Nocardiopsis composta TaxID=157465 RepID=A0A7W8VCN2_9ACTN|nr:hypothetical protein [Nocardiopsis composta]MBB5431155.1 hypothetical protein [Nocardiopsis composta]